MSRRGELVAFVGPSLPWADARHVAPGCRLFAPARHGDVYRVLALRPRAIALIDGVFEAHPSVWHKELLAALDGGVAVFGASSMGALRASELWAHGVVGVGTIYEWYRKGRLVDDADVALLHADAEHGFRPLTVPLVNVLHVAEVARRRRVLSGADAEALVRAARALHYQERTWPALHANVEWSGRVHKRFDAFAARGLPDLKREDAVACLRAASAFVQSGAPPPPGPGHLPSALVRGRRLRFSSAWVDGEEVDAARVLHALEERGDADALAEAGLRRLLLSAWARSLGLRASRAEIDAEWKRWRLELGLRVPSARAFLAASGLDAAEQRVLLEQRVLERKLLHASGRVVPDGPSWLEGLASEARLRGIWAELTSRSHPRRSRIPRSHPRRSR